jgi:hypothetical protein
MSKFKSVYVILALLLILPIGSMMIKPATVQAAKGDELQAQNGVFVITNGIYTVSVISGYYTVATGASHPYPNKNILFGGASNSPGSTYNTIRFYESLKEYCNSGATASPGFSTVYLSSYLTSEIAVGSTITTTWTIPAENAVVVQVLAIEGTTLADSRVRVTTSVSNGILNGASGGGVQPAGTPSTFHIGIRYLWDIMVANIDGAFFRPRDLDGTWLGVEADFIPPVYNRYEITDNYITPLFSVFGTANSAPLTPSPTPPNRIAYASWQHSFGKAFDYSITDSIHNDSAVLYYWGANSPGIAVSPGNSYSVTQYLTAMQPPPVVETLAATQVTTNSAVINGNLVELGFASNVGVSFEWGTVPGGPYPNVPPSQSKTAPGAFSANLNGLAPGTYYYRAKGVGSSTAYGKEMNFTIFAEAKKNFNPSEAPTVGNPSHISVKNTWVQQQKVAMNEPVTIFANMSNSGDLPGGYTANLKINGQVEATRTGSVPGNAAVPIQFTITKSQPGDYEVDINGQKAYFSVVGEAVVVAPLVDTAATATSDTMAPDNTAKNVTYVVFGVMAFLAILLGILVIQKRRSSYY